MGISDQSPPGGISLRRNFSYAFLGRVVYAASLWGILVVVAKLTTPQVVGRYSLALAITAPVFSFLNLRLRALLATDARGEYTFGSYLGLRLITTTLAFLLIAGFVLWTGYSLEAALVVLAVGLAKAFESVSDLLFGQMQKSERMDYMGRSLMLKGPLSLLCMGLVIHLTDSLWRGIFGLVAVWAGLLFLFDKRNTVRVLKSGEHLQPSWCFRKLGRLAWLAAPLGVQTMLISLNSSVPRYFVRSYHGEAMLGYFTAIAYILVAGSTVIFALQQAASPRLALYYARDLRGAFTGLLIKLIGIGFALGCAGVLVSLVLGQQLLMLFFGSEYARFAGVLVWMMLAGVALCTRAFVIAAMTALRLVRVQSYVSAVCLAVNSVAGLLLIPRHGCMGGAWSILASAWLSLFLYGGIVVYHLKRRWASK